MKKYVLLTVLSIVFLTGLFLNGCGGGGGGGDGDGADTTPPTVVSTVPATDATGVALNSAITATFSEDMDPSTITASTFTLESWGLRGLSAEETVTISATVSYSAGSRTAILTPDEDFAYSTNYTAAITTGATDLAGNALADIYSWNFSSGDNPDTTAPRVVSTIPGADAIDVSPEITQITATFSEDMDPNTIHQDSCGVVDTESGERLGDVSYSNRTLVLTPDLQYNKTYEGYIKSTVADLAGNELGEDYEWTFSTEVDTMPPSIVSVWPEPDEEHNFVFDKTPRRPLTVTFDDDMKEGSIDYETYYIEEYDGEDYLEVNFGLAYEDKTASMTVGGDEVGLEFNTTYYVTVDGGIQDKAGNYLDLDGESAVSWGIERKRAGEPELCDGQNNYHTGYHRLAVRPVSDEDFVMVWVEIYDEDNKNGVICAEYWDASAGEGGEYQGNTYLSGGDPWYEDCAEPRVVMDDDGNAVAVWLQGYVENGYYENVYAARLPSGGTWGEPEIISDSGETSREIQNLDIATDGANVVVVWDQITDDANGNIWSNFYDGGWGVAQEVSENVDEEWGYANSPRIVLDSGGDGYAFWHQHNLGETGDIHTVRIRSGGFTEGWGWNMDTTEISVTTKQTEDVVAAEDGDGNYMALWLQDDTGDGFAENLYSSYYNGSAWSSPHAHTGHTGDTSVGSIDFAFDSASGDGVAVWSEVTGLFDDTDILFDLFSGEGFTWNGRMEIYEPEHGLVALPVVRYTLDEEMNYPVCVFAHTDLQTYGRLMYNKLNYPEWEVVTDFEDDDVHMPAMQISGDDVAFQYFDELSIGIDSSDMLHAVWADGPAEYEANCVSNHFFVGTEEEPPPPI